MLWRDVIDLVAITTGRNANGFPSDTETNRTIFANKKSVGQSEFYQASALGINLAIMFEVNTDDYNGETALDYNNVRYYIVRTYSKNDEITELHCSDKLLKGGGKGGK